MAKKPKKQRDTIASLREEIRELKYEMEREREEFQDALFNASMSREHWKGLSEELHQAREQIRHKAEEVIALKRMNEELQMAQRCCGGGERG